MDKLITFAVPCYNSAAYMDALRGDAAAGGRRHRDHSGGRRLHQRRHPRHLRPLCPSSTPISSGPSTRRTAATARESTRASGNARGVYYKVVDSDDWVDVPALKKALDKLRQFVRDGKLVDMLVCNYVYEHVEDNTQRVMHYRNVFPSNRVFGWEQIGRFRPSQYLLMHSVIYRTQLLRDCGLELPKHTFYVDNIFVYQPLPSVQNIYYLDVDLYRYFIGRADQSVNETVMVGRVDQQLRVTYHMIDSHDLRKVLAAEQPQAGAVHVQLSGHDDGHLLHLPHHRRHPRVPGEEAPSCGSICGRWTPGSITR